MHSKNADETRRKYAKVLRFLAEHCGTREIVFVDAITLEVLDAYERGRAAAISSKWTWLKELEILQQFFDFCLKRKRCTSNPAADMKRPKIEHRDDDIVPYSTEEITRMIRACDQFGRTHYERLRARAMVLLLRNTGMRISDVVTLSRDHIQGTRLVKQCIKNKRLIRVELPPVVIEALDRLPLPKEAPRECRTYFASGSPSVRSLVKGAERTLASVFKNAGVQGAYPHRFRHTLASQLLAKGERIEVVAAILGDTPAIISRHYAKWTPEYQSSQDRAIRKIHGTDLAQPEEKVVIC